MQRPSERPLTDLMWHTLEQVCAGQKYVDVRSAAALQRRGLATFEPGKSPSGDYLPIYTATEAGMKLNTERQMSKVVAGNKMLRAIVALFGGPQP